MKRLAGWGALLFVVTNIVGFIVAGTPPKAADSAAEVARYFSDKHDQLQIQLILTGILGVFFVPIVAQLWSVLRESDRERGEAWTIVGLFGAIGIGAAAGVNTIVYGAMIQTVGSSTPEVFDSLWALVMTSGASFGVPIFLFFAGFGMAAQKSGALPSWMNYVGYLAGVVGLVATVGLVSDADVWNMAIQFTFLPLMVWMLGAAVLWIKGDRAAA